MVHLRQVQACNENINRVAGHKLRVSSLGRVATRAGASTDAVCIGGLRPHRRANGGRRFAVCAPVAMGWASRSASGAYVLSRVMRAMQRHRKSARTPIRIAPTVSETGCAHDASRPSDPRDTLGIAPTQIAALS